MNTLKYSFSYIILSAICALFCTYTSATILTTNEGLPSSLINNIYQTNDEQVWIATEDGLARYDGTKCTAYHFIPGDSTSLICNYTRMTYETKNGDIYIGALHGLMRYNRDYDTFQNIKLITNAGNEAAAYITGISEMSNGDVYIATSGHGLFILRQGQHSAQQLDSNIGYYITCTFIDSKDNIWIATSDKGNSKICNNGFIYTVKTEHDATLTTFVEDQHGEIYSGSQRHGLMHYNTLADCFETVCNDTKDFVIQTLVAVENGILIGTDGNGVKFFNSWCKKLKEYDLGPQTFNAQTAKVHAALIDKWGNLWLGLFQKGVVVIPAQRNKFNYIGYKSASKNLIGSNYISAVLTSADHKRLYVGTDNDGIYIVDTENWQLIRHFDKPHTTMCLTSDNNGNVLVGTYTEGLWTINTNNNNITHSNLLNRYDGSVPPITQIRLTSNGAIWISTMGEGLFVIQPGTNYARRFETVNGLEYNPGLNMLHNKWISAMEIANDNLIYIGTQDGIGCYDINNNSFLSTFGTNRLLADYTVVDFAIDGNGEVWIVTNKGLMKYSPKSNEIRTFKPSDGLPVSEIKAIQHDSNGNIWGTTSNRMFLINYKSMEITSFYQQDGLITTEFAKQASSSTTDGYVFFGATDGITYFNTDDISTTSVTPIIKVADFFIKGQRVLPSTMSGRYKVEHSESDSILHDKVHYDLCHLDNTFAIEFTTQQRMTLQRLSYLYSINGEPMTDTGNGNNRISFRDMKPGLYTIKVQSNNDGHLSDPIEVTIEVHPAIWETLWAKIIYVILIITVIYIIHKQNKTRRRTKAKLIETLHNQQVHDAKMQMFTDIAHEIRTPMSLVISPLNYLMAKDTDPERLRNYDIIERNTQRILRLMTQILDIQKIDSGKLELHFFPTVVSNIIRNVCTTFNFEAHAKNITLNVDTERTEGVVINVDNSHFDKIITNLVSNAIKYTPEGGEVNVRTYIRSKDDQEGHTIPETYVIEVEDNGNGFTDEEAEHLFDRFHRLPNAIESGNVGFGVGLDLTRTLVELHHGTIKATNCTSHKGAIMRICLPVEQLTEQNVTNSDEHSTDNNTDNNIQDNLNQKPRYKHTILFADDDEDMRKYVRKHVGEHFNVITCHNGQEALTTLLDREVDLVVTDVMMPVMDGFTLCKNIKSNVNISHIPVIILTSRSTDTDRIESYEIGADAYIAKPFNVEVLIASIKSLISRIAKIKVDVKAKETVEAQKMDVGMAQTLDDKLLEKVTAMINKHISDSNYSIEDLASDVGYSRVHLHRKMREMTGLTTRDYVRNVRMKYASELLAEKGYEIADVAIMTGYATTNYFSQAFRAYYGMTPTAYIEKNKGTDKTE